MKPMRMVGGEWRNGAFMPTAQSRDVADGTAIMLVFEAGEGDMPATALECRTVGDNVAEALIRMLERSQEIAASNMLGDGKAATNVRSN